MLMNIINNFRKLVFFELNPMSFIDCFNRVISFAEFGRIFETS